MTTHDSTPQHNPKDKSIFQSTNSQYFDSSSEIYTFPELGISSSNISKENISNIQRLLGNQAAIQLLRQSQSGQKAIHQHNYKQASNKPILRMAQTHEKGCSCASCTGIQRHHDETLDLDRIQRHGDDLDRKPIQRTEAHEKGCGCASCTGIQRHHDETLELDRIQRHHDDDLARKPIQRTEAHEKGCGCASCTGIQRHHDETLELDRIQRHDDDMIDLNGIQRMPVKVQHTAKPSIQRHVAYEHYVLGQVEPEKLGNIAFVRELRDKLASGEIEELSKSEMKKAREVKHTLEQEMSRLYEWKNDPEKLNDKSDEIGTVTKGEDDVWQVPIVKIPVKAMTKNAVAGSDSIIVTYSEINTLPDFFGNPAAMKNTRKDKVLGILQGVRQQSYIELSNIRDEVFGGESNKLSSAFVDGDFDGALGPRGQAVVDKAYEIRTESDVQSATEVGKKSSEKSETYFAALERNACHFAPDSWDQWQSYHTQARAKATEANKLNKSKDKKKQEKGKELANEAMLLNAFGEHYLQDSFAAGHLIDKTGIMQAFTKYLDKEGVSMGSTDRFQAQWDMSKMISKKKLKSNPQALDDKMMNGDLNSIMGAAQTVGLDPTPEIIFMMWWRAEAHKSSEMQTRTAAELAKAVPSKVSSSPEATKKSLEKLVLLNFAEKDTESRGVLNFFSGKEFTVYKLKSVYVNSLAGFFSLDDHKAYKSKLGTELEEGEEHNYEAEAAEFNLQAYNAFLSNAYIQAATKYFHDTFCKQGVDVVTGEGVDIGTIYGDANMLNSGAQKGVQYSAETSQMSREAIFNLINGDDEKVKDTAAIRKRFPTHVNIKDDKGKVTATKSLANWQKENLHTDELFAKARDGGARLVYKVKEGGGISEGNAINMDKIVEDTKHGNGEF